MGSSTARSLGNSTLHLSWRRTALDFRRTKSDPNLYVHDSKQLYILDDLMAFGSQADVSTLIQDLQKDSLLKVTGTLDESQSSSFLCFAT